MTIWRCLGCGRDLPCLWRVEGIQTAPVLTCSKRCADYIRLPPIDTTAPMRDTTDQSPDHKM